MKDTENIEIVEFGYDPLARRFGSTYSIRQDGKFWMIGNGSRRRAWSTWGAADDAVLKYKISKIYALIKEDPDVIPELTELEEKLIHEFPDPNDFNGRNYDDE